MTYNQKDNNIMNLNMKTNTLFMWCIALLMAGSAMQSCKDKNENFKTGDQPLLVVERQQTEFEVGDDEQYPLAFIVDVPVAGSQVLKDSIKAFINEQLYQFIESQVGQYDEDGKYKKTMSFDEVRTDDTGKLLKHYIDVYKPYMEKEVGWRFTYSVSMLAQTDNFVTYGVIHYRCGAVCSSELRCYTFSKEDGHRLRDIISKEDLNKFFADQQKKDDEDDVDWTQFMGDNCFSLLEDQALFAVNGMETHYSIKTLDYKEILPYLSKEAQTFVNGKGDKNHCPWEQWFLGQQLGQIVSNTGDTICVMEREFDPSVVENFEPNFKHFYDTELLTFHYKNGKYIPYVGFKTGEQSMSSILLATPDEGMYLTSYDNRSSYEGMGKIHSFDKDKRELYVRYLTDEMFRETYVTAVRIYRFDGMQFVDTGKDL